MRSSPKINKKIIKILMNGGVGVMPTDTIYGLMGSATNQKTVLRIYKLKSRSPKKPMIALISSIGDLNLFSIRVNQKFKKWLKQFWPGKVSIILPCPKQKFFYLHRGLRCLAFRLPRPLWLRNFLKKTGPLVATSANPEGQKPAEDIVQAKIYFGKKVDFYVTYRKMKGLSSTLIEIKGNNVIVRRKGSGKLHRKPSRHQVS